MEQVFYEEELDVPLVLFNEVLDHVLRIDRIFRQPQVSAQPCLALYLSSPLNIKIPLSSAGPRYNWKRGEFDRHPLLEILRARKCVGDCRISRTRVTRDLTQLSQR